MQRFLTTLLFVLTFSVQSAFAQQEDAAWVQIEAHSSLAATNQEIIKYANVLEDVNGFALGGGWYGIALGPYTRADAETVLRGYRSQGLIPRDSYIAFTSSFRSQFWPIGANLLDVRVNPVDSVGEQTSEITQNSVNEPVAEITQVTPADETPREARASEARLTRDEKRDLQTWLQWAGFYNAAIDGSFGRGTRASMSAWQAANNYETTGVLTTAQRIELKAQYDAVLEGLGLQTVTNTTVGIEMLIPTDVVALGTTEYPFATYNPTADVDAQVILISQSGDQTTLFGLYDIMQTLEMVPLDGPRERRNRSFTLVGEDATRISHTEVSLQDGEIKGFTLVWPAGDEERRRRLLSEMRSSFTRIEGVMDPSIGEDAAQDLALLSGLEIRKPQRTRSGFFINASGAVVTTADAVGNCRSITLEEQYEAELIGVNEQLGVALLKPQTALAPIAVASFRSGEARLNSEIAVAGYSFGGLLGAPTVTFGTLADVRGLQGEEELTRLALAPLPGDAGGPVFDTGGSVLGMLLPQAGGTDRQLPADVSFAADGAAILELLGAEGISASSAETNGVMAPEDLTAHAGDMTVLVSCW